MTHTPCFTLSHQSNCDLSSGSCQSSCFHPYRGGGGGGWTPQDRPPVLWHIQERQAPAVGSQWAFCLAWLRACCSREYRERERERRWLHNPTGPRCRIEEEEEGEERTRVYVSLRSTAPLSVVLAFRSLDQPISSSLFDLEVSFLKPFSHLSLSLSDVLRVEACICE